MNDRQQLHQAQAGKLDSVGKLRVDTLYEQIRTMTLAAPRDVQRKLIRTITDDGARFFNGLVSRIGDSAARDLYAAHMLIGSTPSAHIHTLDFNGECEAEMKRIHDIVTAATAQAQPEQ